MARTSDTMASLSDGFHVLKTMHVRILQPTATTPMTHMAMDAAKSVVLFVSISRSAGMEAQRSRCEGSMR